MRHRDPNQWRCIGFSITAVMFVAYFVSLITYLLGGIPR